MIPAVVAAIFVVGLLGAYLVARRPRRDDGVASFRRHIDALSPEARREVMNRVRPSHLDPPADPRGMRTTQPSRPTAAPDSDDQQPGGNH
jgi:hypothetical protein